MSNEPMREKFNITQRPENPRLFLASEMANALEVTLPTFYTLARKLDLDNIKKPDGRGQNVLYFTHDSLKRCEEELKRREDAEKVKREIVRVEIEAAQAEHPLVKDKRLLKLSYFPDVVPACFAEVD